MKTLEKFKTGKMIAVSATVMNAITTDGKAPTMTVMRPEHQAPIGELVALYVELVGKRSRWFKDPRLEVEIQAVQRVLDRIGTVCWGE